MGREADYRSNSLVRGLSILQCFDPRHPEMTLGEIAEAIGVTSSAAYRFVVTLEQEGYLARHANRYRLAPRVMELGYRYVRSLDVYDIARAPADRLRDATGFTVHVAVLEGTEIVYVYRAPSSLAMVSNVPVGARLPAFSTTMGRVLLAGLAEEELERRFAGYAFASRSPRAPGSLDALRRLLVADRARGHVAQRSHVATGTFAIAAPLVSGHGDVVAAINLSGHEQQLRPDPEMIAQVRATAQDISRML
ncbi:IclR family transcriptional regulator [Paroceanicella profunda]|uniref:IclR family transcriptional regulator n=1 Tax=Paroceanicella profunda TaxID=2579971 RepID=A0A5B8FPT8_9RHOB|nr:IclR family transcriptional regulator [Paroceanicella profunda]QDL90546.1 IclR family transcriptional regulator [Paroceanicella profunda]